MKRRNKNRFSRPISLEQLETRELMAADWVPDTSEWGTAMVFNKAKSTFQNIKPDQTSFLPTDTIYIAASFKNAGDAVAGTFRVDFHILVDDVLTDTEFYDFDGGHPLEANSFFGRINFSAGKLGVGTHTIKLVVDANDALVESNEGNNIASRQITVTGDPASKVSFVGGVKPALAGATIAPVKVKVTNNKNQPIFNETVQLGIFSGPNGATLLGTLSATTNNKGEAVFSNLSLEKAGTYKLVATDGALTSPLSPAFKISPGALATLEFTQVLGSVFAGDTFNSPIAVKAADAFGNGIKGKVIKLALAAAPVGDKVYGPPSAVTDANGIATFPKATFHIAGAHTLVASNLTTGVTVTGQSNSFLVRAGSMKSVIFVQLPVGAVHGVATTMEGAVADAYGNEIDLDLLEMGISLVAKPAGAWLQTSNYNQDITNGHATFPDLVFTKAGKYSVRLTVGLASSVSSVFTVS